MNKRGISINYPLVFIIFGISFILFIGLIMWDIDKKRENKHDEAPKICEELELKFLTIETGFADYVVCFNNETKEVQRIKIW